MSGDFEVVGSNDAAPFTLKVHRGEGMALLAMDWRDGEPPAEFVGFAIEYTPPGSDSPTPVPNRLSFPRDPGAAQADQPPDRSSRSSPIQMFRWLHFPPEAELEGEFRYVVTPVSMDEQDALSYGEAQEVRLELRRETYPGELNVTFTRGFVSSQAFVDRYAKDGPISELLPQKADAGLTYTPTHPDSDEALRWMGFEAREAILGVLREATDDADAQVRVVAYDLNEPEVVDALEATGGRLKAIIDDSDAHGEADSAEAQAEQRLKASAGDGNVKRQHMGNLQHNKMIVVDGPRTRAVVCGSTNFSWRGFYVQSNNAVVLRGEAPVKVFRDAFDAFWDNDDPAGFGATDAAKLTDLGLADVDAKVAFSPHSADNALLAKIADDIRSTESSLLYSLAFLYQTPGVILDAINDVTNRADVFVYGISDRKVGGIDVHKPGATNPLPVHPEALTEHVPEPFKAEPTGGGGIRMHHKFVVIDFDKPTARTYLGSYNFSVPADRQNGENLVVVRDRRVATAYACEALGIFDHYHFRVVHEEAKEKDEDLHLVKPPRAAGEKPWWDKWYTDATKARDRRMFA